MARKKSNDTLLLLAGVAVVGYFLFKKGGALNPPGADIAEVLPFMQTKSAAGIALGETIKPPGPNVYAPNLDLTGQSIQLM